MATAMQLESPPQTGICHASLYGEPAGEAGYEAPWRTGTAPIPPPDTTA